MGNNMTPIGEFSNYREIGTCSQPLPENLCLIVTVQPEGQQEQAVSCFNIFDAINEDVQNRPSMLDEYNQGVEGLSAAGFTSVCRSEDQILPGHYALFASREPAEDASDEEGSGAGPLFPSCNPMMMDNAKRTLAIPLTREVAAYLTAQFPFVIDGCSQVSQDGSIYFKITPELVSINYAINNINDDINNNTLPPNISREKAQELLDALDKIRQMDPTILAERSMRRQEEMADDAAWTQLWYALLSLVGMGGIFFGISVYSARKSRQVAIDTIEGRLGRPTTLEDITLDMVQEERVRLAENRTLNEIMGRDAEAIRYLKALARPEYANPLLVGESGVGKDMVVRRAAQLIALKDPRIPEIFKNGSAKLLYVRSDAFQAGTGIRGSAAARAKLLIDAMKAGNFIYSPELVDMATAGIHSGGSEESLASLLKPVLDKPWARWSGSTTPENYVRFLRVFRDYQRRFPVIEVKELSPEIIRSIIAEKISPWYAEHYNVEISTETIDEAIRRGNSIYHEQFRMPKVDAIKQALLDGIEYAMCRSASADAKIVVKPEDISKGIEERVQASFGGDDDDSNPTAVAGGGGWSTTGTQSGSPQGSTSSEYSIIPGLLVPRMPTENAVPLYERVGNYIRTYRFGDIPFLVPEMAEPVLAGATNEGIVSWTSRGLSFRVADITPEVPPMVPESSSRASRTSPGVEARPVVNTRAMAEAGYAAAGGALFGGILAILNNGIREVVPQKYASYVEGPADMGAAFGLHMWSATAGGMSPAMAAMQFAEVMPGVMAVAPPIHMASHHALEAAGVDTATPTGQVAESAATGAGIGLTLVYGSKYLASAGPHGLIAAILINGVYYVGSNPEQARRDVENVMQVVNEGFDETVEGLFGSGALEFTRSVARSPYNPINTVVDTAEDVYDGFNWLSQKAFGWMF